MGKRKDADPRSTLTTTQEVLYAHEFKKADRAGGYSDQKKRK
ncbi:MAG TPA: YfhE family protein [Bacillaceae bacterium]